MLCRLPGLVRLFRRAAPPVPASPRGPPPQGRLSPTARFWQGTGLYRLYHPHRLCSLCRQSSSPRLLPAFPGIPRQGPPAASPFPLPRRLGLTVLAAGLGRASLRLPRRLAPIPQTGDPLDPKRVLGRAKLRSRPMGFPPIQPGPSQPLRREPLMVRSTGGLRPPHTRPILPNPRHARKALSPFPMPCSPRRPLLPVKRKCRSAARRLLPPWNASWTS